MNKSEYQRSSLAKFHRQNKHNGNSKSSFYRMKKKMQEIYRIEEEERIEQLECEAEEYLIELAFQMLDEEAERADIIHQEYKNHIELLIEKGILIRLNVRLTTFKKKNMECFQSWLDFMICIDKNTSSYG